jgi:hypothetical protein
MEYTDHTLQRLRNALPWGYAQKLQERLLKKTGKRLTTNSIRRHLTLPYANTDTISEALILAEEYKAERIKNATSIAKMK